MTTVHPLSHSWEDVYHANLMAALLAPGHELINHTFTLAPFFLIDERAIGNPARGFRREFSDVMADWILSGEVEISLEMLELNPNAHKFGTTFPSKRFEDPICTAYGPRLVHQIPYIIRELSRDPSSRRACIMMLSLADNEVAEALAAGDTNCEYLCTYAFNFRIRKGALDMVASMRSNNYTTTVCQDVYVFSRLQEYLAERLGVSVGHYYHSTVSGHIFAGEEEKAVAILKAYYDAHTAPEFYGVQPSRTNGWIPAVEQLKREGLWK